MRATNSAVTVMSDLDGNPRFDDDPAAPDGGQRIAPVVDLGAFELQVDLTPLDDTVDFLALAATRGPCPGCPADLDGNGVVDTFDFLTLLANRG